MSDQEVPFFTQAAILDQYVQSANPGSDPETLEVIIEVLRTQSDLRKYFFSRGPHPSWAAVLFEHGFFAKPPEPEETSRGYRLPHWDVQEFLVSVARHAADVVVKHVTTIEGHAFYKGRAVHAVRYIPPDVADSVLSVILGWLNDPHVISAIAEETYGLMVELAKNRKAMPAFDLFRAIMAPRPPQNVNTIGEGIVVNTEAVSILGGDLGSDEYRRGEMQEGLSLLRELDMSQTAAALEEMLCSALKIQADAEKFPAANLSFWRNAIEDTGQDQFGHYKDFLLEALRDTLESWTQQNSEAVAAITEKYLQHPHEILRRLGIHLLKRFPADFKGLVSRELLKPENLDDVGIHHEYFMLLQHGYPHLAPAEQAELVDRILAGPPAEHLHGVVEDDPDDEKEKHARKYSNWWIRDRLWMIREHLPGSDRETLNRLVSEIGTPDHAEFTHWSTGAYFVSHVSPATEEELSQMSPDELVRYLRDWNPSQNRQIGPERESHRALGGVATRIIWSNLETYRDRIVEVAFIRPEYAINLLNRARETEIDPAALWDVRLTLCEGLLTDEHIRNDMTRSGDSSWIEFRLYVAHLLGDTFKPGEVSIPNEFLPRVKDILITLIDDPDPTQESDQPKEGWVGHKDPITVAINHVRSQALTDLIHYANHVAIQEEEISPKPAGTNRMEPAVEAILTRKVNRANDPSVALHSVFGREFARLYRLNQPWLRAHIDDIFPPGNDEESILFYVAAWDAYVIGNATYSDIFQLLRDKYDRAIENLSKGYVTKTHLEPTRRLAEHLLAEYLYSDYDLRSPEGQQSLIASFFNRSSSHARGRAVWSLWNIGNQDRDNLEKFWPRARALWHWRVDMASGANHSFDFNREMEWFSYLLKLAPESETLVTLWPLIEGLLPYIGRDEYSTLLWRALEEYIAKEVVKDSVRAIQFYRLMHDQLRSSIWYHGTEPRKIIEEGASNIDSRQETLKLIDRIARLGNHSFDHIYERYVK